MTVIYSAASSLDGFIAGPGGDMSWLTPFLGDPDLADPAAERLRERTGCLLVGGRTHRGDDPNAGTDAEGAFGGRYDGPAVVLTRRGHPHPGAPAGAPGEPEMRGDVRSAVARATELAGDLDVVVLGAETARGCLDEGLLDEVLLFLVPVLLGDGVRVLDRPGGPSVQLARKEGETGHWYDVVR